MALTLTRADVTAINNITSIGPGGSTADEGKIIVYTSWNDDTSHGYSHSGSGSGSDQDCILLSTDGGKTFQELSDVTPSGKTNSFAAASVFDTDDGPLILAGKYNTDEAWYSKDLGETWLESDMSAISVLSASNLFFQNPVTGNFITCKKHVSGAHSNSISKDNGATWEPLSWPGGNRHYAGGWFDGRVRLFQIQRIQSAQSNIVVREVEEDPETFTVVKSFYRNSDYKRDNGINTLAVGQSRIVVCAGGKLDDVIPVHISDEDDSSNWTRVDIPLAKVGEKWKMVRYEPSTDKFFACTDRRIFSSEDGLTWVEEFDVDDYVEAGLSNGSMSIADIIPVVQNRSIKLSVVARAFVISEMTSIDLLYYTDPVGELPPDLPPPPTDDNDDGVDDSLQPGRAVLELGPPVDPAEFGVILRSENYTGVLNSLIDALNVSLPLLVDSDQAEALDAPLNANLNRLTNLAPATENNDLVTLAQVKAALGIS